MIWRVVLVHCSVGSLIEFWFLSSLTEDLSPTVFSALHCKDIEQRRFQCIAMNCNSLLGNAIQWKAEGERREAAFCVSLDVAARQTLLNGFFCSGQTSQWSESISQVSQLTLHRRAELYVNMTFFIHISWIRSLNPGHLVLNSPRLLATLDQTQPHNRWQSNVLEKTSRHQLQKHPDARNVLLFPLGKTALSSFFPSLVQLQKLQRLLCFFCSFSVLATCCSGCLCCFLFSVESQNITMESKTIKPSPISILVSHFNRFGFGNEFVVSSWTFWKSQQHWDEKPFKLHPWMNQFQKGKFLYQICAGQN